MIMYRDINWAGGPRAWLRRLRHLCLHDDDHDGATPMNMMNTATCARLPQVAECFLLEIWLTKISKKGD